MYFDSPIRKKEEDVFERANFSIHIADQLISSKNAPSQVTALTGKWGEGKTSTINLIKEKIQATRQDAAIIDFNPWLIGSLESIIEGFLVQLASSINHKFNNQVASQAAGKLLSFAKFLSPIKLLPGIEPWGTIVTKTLEVVGTSTKAAVDMTELDLLGRKKSVQEAINELGKPIVVIIDDIDRLPPEEVRIIFQVVKAVCDFENVSYLLAYDPEPVTESLSYNKIYDGHKYLEKIVLASYPLPRIGYWQLKSFLKKHISTLLLDLGISLSLKDESILKEALDTTAIVRSLSTPRDVIRIINRLKLTAKSTDAEVTFADVLAFETIELKYPKISMAIRAQPEMFLNKTIIDGDLIIRDRLDEITEFDRNKDSEIDEPSFIKNMLNEKTYTLIDKKNIRSIISFIFPSVFDNSISSDDDEFLFDKRISTREALLTLLHSGLTNFIFSNSEIKHFLTSTNDRKEILIDKLESGRLHEWIHHTSQFSTGSEIVDPTSICDEFLKISQTAFTEKKLNLRDAAGQFIFVLLSNLKHYKTRITVFNKLCSNRISLSISERVLILVLSQNGLWAQGTFKEPKEGSNNYHEIFPITQSDLIEAKDIWLASVRKEAVKSDIFTNEPEPISILFRWGQLNNNNFDEVKYFIKKTTENNAGLKAFLDCCHRGMVTKGIEILIDDPKNMIEKIESLKDKPASGDDIAKYLRSIIDKNNQNK